MDKDKKIDRARVIARGLTAISQWSLRLLLIAAAAYLLWRVLGLLWKGLLPIILALILCSVLRYPMGWLRKLGFPRTLASATVIILSIAFISAIIAIISPIIVHQWQVLYLQALESIQRIQLWLQGPPFYADGEDVENWFGTVVNWVQTQSTTIAGQVVNGISIASDVIIDLVMVIILSFFFLKDGHRFLPWLQKITGPRIGIHVTEFSTRAWNTLSGFIRAQALVSLVDAIFIGAGLFFMNIPMALILAIITFFTGFIPIIGAVVAGALAVMVAFITHGIGHAVAVLVLVLVVQQLEGNILSPLLQSRAMKLHPVIILVVVTTGGAQWGIIGAFLAVPVAATVAVLFRYINEQLPAE
ncbi:MAG: AI-2E family transporter [Corynebacterium sp.]|nr:AI-2E family transporter [Corynebacterium sp.]